MTRDDSWYAPAGSRCYSSTRRSSARSIERGPKAGAPLVQTSGDELKLVFPQEDATPDMYADLGFGHFSLQPMDGTERERNTRLALEYCLSHPQWSLSIQTHKYLGIP